MVNLFGDTTKDELEEEAFKVEPVPKLFDWLTSINTSKVDLRYNSVNSEIGPDSVLKGFEPFIINKGLGQSAATIGFANLMNRLAHIPKEAQYNFLRLGIPKNKSFGKWSKEDKILNIKEVMIKLGCTKEKAKEAILVLGEDGVKQLLLEKGGIQKKVRRKK